MKQKLRLFAIHQTTTSLHQTYNLNPRTKWYPALDESNWMKSQFIRVKLSSSKWLPVETRLCFKSTGFTSSTFQFNRTFLKNQLAAITLNKYRFSRDIASVPPNKDKWGQAHFLLSSSRALIVAPAPHVLGQPQPTKTNPTFEGCSVHTHQRQYTWRYMSKIYGGYECKWAFNGHL